MTTHSVGSFGKPIKGESVNKLCPITITDYFQFAFILLSLYLLNIHFLLNENYEA